MSRATKRKHVTKEVLEDYYEPEDGEQIVKIIAARGNNLHEVQTAHGEKFLVSMPNKFRKNVWVKRGDFVVMESIKEGNKVLGEIVYILYPKQIRYLKQQQLWPTSFEETTLLTKDVAKMSIECQSKDEVREKSNSSDSSSNEDDIFPNTNHRSVVYYEDDDTSSDDDDKDHVNTNDMMLSSNENERDNNENLKSVCSL